jgi:hypothetical protein
MPPQFSQTTGRGEQPSREMYRPREGKSLVAQELGGITAKIRE